MLTPLLISLAIAYIFNPLVTWLERRAKIRRLTSVIALYCIGGVALLWLGVMLTARTIEQYIQFRDNLPAYVSRIGELVTQAASQDDTLARWMSEHLSHLRAASQPAGPGAASPVAEPVTISIPATVPASLPAAAGWPSTAPASAPASRPSIIVWRQVGPLLQQYGMTWLGRMFNSLATLFGDFLAIASVLVLIPMYTLFFLWRFNDMLEIIRVHLPADYRPRIEFVARTIDGAVAVFFRGRLTVCVLVGTLNGIGWTVVGVPYGMLWGILAGVLNLVPYIGVLALPPTLLFSYLDATRTGEPWFWPVLLAMAVFLIVQAIESFLLSPLIESRTSGLHPITTVVALLIGGKLMGLLGMLLAIPFTVTLKTLARELIMPEIRRLAGLPPPGGTLVTIEPPSIDSSAGGGPPPGAAQAPAASRQQSLQPESRPPGNAPNRVDQAGVRPGAEESAPREPRE